MSRRTAASIPRGPVHVADEDPNAPGCCRTCHRSLSGPNDRHVTSVYDLPSNPNADAEARRLGEREDPS